MCNTGADISEIEAPSTKVTPPPEQNPTRAVSESHSLPSAPPLVVPQKPNMPPPTLQTLPRPLSAQKRAASLIRQLQRPRKSVDSKDTVSSSVKREFDGSNCQNEQGPPPRKKPYKSLELNTVDTPHLYMTRAKPATVRTRPRKPPPILHSNPRSVSREKLLLTETSSNGYIIPASNIEEEDGVEQMYQKIEAGTRDYLELYTVPRQHTPSTSSEEEQPIYEEPIIN